MKTDHPLTLGQANHLIAVILNTMRDRDAAERKAANDRRREARKVEERLRDMEWANTREWATRKDDDASPLPSEAVAWLREQWEGLQATT